MDARELKVLQVEFEKKNGQSKKNIGVFIYLDAVAGKIIILTSDDELRQQIKAKLSKVKNLSESDIQAIKKEGGAKEKSILRKIKNALLNRKRKGVLAKGAEYLVNFRRVVPIF
jgi:hypothetical protein